MSRNSKLQLVVAITFAAAILISSKMLAGTDYGSTVMFLLIAAWWVPFTLLNAAEGETPLRDELRCIKRRLFG